MKKSFSSSQSTISKQAAPIQQPTEKSWHIDIDNPQYAEALNKNEYIFPASKKDWSKVLEIYQQSPVPGYDLKEVNVILNKQLNRLFEGRLDALNNRHNVLVFKATWEQDSHPEWRRKVNDMAEELAKPYADPTYPHVKLMPLWHGTSPEALSVIVKTGYANLATTDSGYFGKGYYSSREAEYAHRVYSHGTLVLNWVSFYSAYPTIAGDKEKLVGKTNYANYDAHFVPVIPPDGKFSKNAMVYLPCEPNQKHQYTEVVVFDSAQCLARYTVVLQPSMPKEPSLLAINDPNQNLNTTSSIDISAEYAFKVGNNFYEKKLYQAALPYLEQAAKQNHTKANKFLANMYALGYGVAENRELSLELSKKAAELGDADSQCFMASMCGLSTVAKYEEKVFWLQKAVAQEYAEGQYELGNCYYEGKGVEQDYKQAVYWYRKAADQENGLAQEQLAKCYEEGTGVAQDFEEAVIWFKKAAEQGYKDAQYHLGNCYYNGQGVLQDYKQAVHWYQNACTESGGSEEAACALGTCYYIGNGVLQDYKQAVIWYQKAADRGNYNGKYSLGICYEYGLGVPKDLQKAITYYEAVYLWVPEAKENLKKLLSENPSLQKYTSNPNLFFTSTSKPVQKNYEEEYIKGKELYDQQRYEEAVQCFRKAAFGGHALAQGILGTCYYYGYGGPQIYKQAVRWYQKAAKQENAIAQYSLGLCYEYGQGTEKNYEQAVYWYQKAADQNYDYGQFGLGHCYAEGIGVIQNIKKAGYWFQKSANQGNEEAKERLKQLIKEHPQLQKFGNNPHITFASSLAPKTTLSNNNNAQYDFSYS